MLTVLILAAGKGTRMRSNLPKVLQPLAAKPLLGHVLDTARALAADRIVVVHGHGAEAVRTAFPQPELSWALQEPQRGTGHAVQCAASEIPDAGVCLVLFGDVPLIRAETLRALLSKVTDGNLALITAVLPDATGYGRVIRDGAGRVLKIVEHKDALAANDHATLAIREMNSGILAAPSAWLKANVGRLQSNNAQAEFYLPDIIPLAIADGKAVLPHVVTDEAEIAGVNDKLQLAELERALQRRLANDLMRSGVLLADPARLDVRGELVCGSDVSIDVGCVFEGKVSLGDGVKVGPYVVMRNATVAAGAEIAAFSHLDGAVVGEVSRIGPYARLRPGAKLARDVHIGNFTEVKASDIGEGSKANHLAYIGDSTIGKNVNIGAGTITCNYDGANKHRTVIEDNVFVGSDTQLVAPVTVREGATIAAGATITKEVPAGNLAITRVKATVIPNWKRPTKQKTQ